MENFNSRRNSHSLTNLLSNRSQERRPKCARVNQVNENLRDWKSSRAPLLHHHTSNEVKKKAKNETASMCDILEQEEKSEYTDRILSQENINEATIASDKSFLPSITLCGFYKPQQYPLHTISRPAILSSKLELHEKQNNKADNSEKYIVKFQNKNGNELEEIIRKRIALPPNKYSKTIILDLDETLVHCSKYIDKNDIIIKLKLPEFPAGRFGVKIRPYANEFLQEISQCFELIVFTASTALYADPILDLLDPENKFFSQRIYRESCIHKGHLKVKDLRIFSNRNLKDLIIIDNSWNSISNQKSNGILISSWYGDLSDHELQDVLSFLKYLCNVKDVRESIKLAPKAFSKHKASKSYNSL